MRLPGLSLVLNYKLPYSGMGWASSASSGERFKCSIRRNWTFNIKINIKRSVQLLCPSPHATDSLDLCVMCSVREGDWGLSGINTDYSPEVESARATTSRARSVALAWRLTVTEVVMAGWPGSGWGWWDDGEDTGEAGGHCVTGASPGSRPLSLSAVLTATSQSAAHNSVRVSRRSLATQVSTSAPGVRQRLSVVWEETLAGLSGAQPGWLVVTRRLSQPLCVHFPCSPSQWHIQPQPPTFPCRPLSLSLSPLETFLPGRNAEYSSKT